MTSHVERYREIAETLARHGLGFLIGAAGLQRWLPFQRGLLGYERREEPYSNPEHLRLALEELGPTFIKLGQLLSTRPDLLPPDYQTELAKLQDAAPPVSGEAIRDVVERELGQSIGELFATFDLEPLASASIGQAHTATLPDGTSAVVKVRRPGIVERIEQDLEILQNLAARAERGWQVAVDYDVVGLADEFARTLRAELDYLQEGRNAERFAANFRGHPDVHIPRIFWNTTTSRVLTLERITGTKVNDLPGLERAGIDRHRLAERATGIMAQMIFDDGFFHGDPHPGNLFIEADGRVGLIDFGIVGELNDELRLRLGRLLVALISKQPDRVASALLALSTARGTVDRALLRRDVLPVIALYDGRTLAQVDIGGVLRAVLSLLRRYRLQLPRQIALLTKMLVMTEGMGVVLDPQFRLGAVLAPYARRLAAARYSPRTMARRLAKSGADLADMVVDLPTQLERAVDILDSGGLEVHLRTAELTPLVQRIERTGQRLVVAIVAGALIDGIGGLVGRDPRRWQSWRVPLVGAGLSALSAFGTYLAFTARRRPHP
jgi:ubiquinone biosynthesis protein